MVGPVPAAWVERRTTEAKQRLDATEGGRLIWGSIVAHGGLSRWLGAGTIEFDFDYRPLKDVARRMFTRSFVDLWSARSFQEELGPDADARLGFDGKQAWIAPRKEAFPSPARFWALTPYYFLGMPWVAADPGAQFEVLPDEDLDGTKYQMVKLTFALGTGDSPDDYYILYLHPDTHRLDALRYIVAYPGFFEKGRHSPEKLMRYTEQKEIDGLMISHRLDTYEWVDAKPGEKVTEVSVDKVRLGQTWPAAKLSRPEGAEASGLVP